MAPTSSPPQPLVLESLPTTPTEEDLAHSPAWINYDEQTPNGKGKSRYVEGVSAGTSDEASQSEAESSRGAAERYPPVNDEEAETRMVEENLRRWEMAERQRRKAARESTSAAAAGQTSLVGDVTRRASMLWPGRKSIQNSRPGLGNHTKLKSQESLDVLPLGSMNGSPGASAATSPAASATSILETPTADKNPFEHPADPVSPFADSHRSPEQDSTLMNESSLPSTPVAKRASGSKRSPDRPVLEATTSYTNPPPPLPLGLPPPRSPPPPRADDVPVDRPPEPTVRPTLAQANTSDVDDGKETRWWHDWLCGCGEGPDRGGESQAGRTNPLE